MATCSQERVTKSQPDMCIAYSSPAHDKNFNIIGAVKLTAARRYDLPNEFGGIGRYKSMDGDGLIFDSMDQARQWAKDHGYVRNWFPSYNPQRKANRAEFFKNHVAPKRGIKL